MPDGKFMLMKLLSKNPAVKHSNKIKNGRNVHEYHEDPRFPNILNASIKKNKHKTYDTMPNIFKTKSDKTDPK